MFSSKFFILLWFPLFFGPGAVPGWQPEMQLQLQHPEHSSHPEPRLYRWHLLALDLNGPVQIADVSPFKMVVFLGVVRHYQRVVGEIFKRFLSVEDDVPYSRFPTCSISFWARPRVCWGSSFHEKKILHNYRKVGKPSHKYDGKTLRKARDPRVRGCIVQTWSPDLQNGQSCPNSNSDSKMQIQSKPMRGLLNNTCLWFWTSQATL